MTERTKIHVVYSSSKPRKKPQTGDIQVTKKHGVRVRIPKKVRNHRGIEIGYDCTGGRQNYVWVTEAELPKQYNYLKKKFEESKDD